MACREHLAAMLPRSPNPLSKLSQAGRKALKTSWLHADKQSARGGEREKAFFKIKGATRECL
jgi:hypothetical protein